MEKNYNKIIEEFCLLGKNIPNVHDLLIRGTSGENKRFVPYWSDLDFTIIVKKIDINVHHAVRALYRVLPNDDGLKISITLVDLDDILSVNHYHGMKPLYYSASLVESKSMLIKDTHYLKKSIIFDNGMKLECYSNVAYLMHDLRIQFIKHGDSVSELADFCRHMAKRVKHLVRNAIYIKSGHTGEEINCNLLREHFNEVDEEFTIKLAKLKSDWPNIKTDKKKLLHTINYLFKNANFIYKNTTDYIGKIE